RSAATCAGVAVSPATSPTGSAGITREITNVTTSNPSSVGTNHASRCSASARSLMTQPMYAEVRAPASPAQSILGEASEAAVEAPSDEDEGRSPPPSQR